MASLPEWVFLPVPGALDTGTGEGERLRSVVAGTLAWVQDWLADDRFADARLVIVTRAP